MQSPRTSERAAGCARRVSFAEANVDGARARETSARAERARGKRARKAAAAALSETRLAVLLSTDDGSGVLSAPAEAFEAGCEVGCEVAREEVQQRDLDYLTSEMRVRALEERLAALEAAAPSNLLS